MNYIYKKDFRINVDGKYIDESMTYYISLLSKANLKSIDSIRSSIKKALKINRNIPLYINKDTLFIVNKKLDTNGCVLFNYLNMDYYITINNQTTIYFKNQSMVTLEASKYQMESLIQRAKKVLEYFSLNWIILKMYYNINVNIIRF